ncbi:MAG TPA: glycosyltransferase family 9 protein [Bradyrhizobium sp.]|nr:glycosyltransferase family 9 protein [Bradyrhizobium sp.]
MAARLDGGHEGAALLHRAEFAGAHCPSGRGRRERFAQFARPWIAIGIGASHPDKDWSDATWSEFLRALRAPGTVFLVGGPANEARAEKFISVSNSGQIVNACGLRLIEAAALLRLADLFIGPSSGPLNLAAAGGTEAFGLFGSTPVLTYS